MAKLSWKSLSPAYKLSIVLVVAGAAYWFLGDAPSASKSTTKRTVANKSGKAKEGQFTDADYTASFAVLTESPKDSFKPLIVRSNVRDEALIGKPNAVPAYMAGGDPNWIYSGTAEVDGVPTALLENGTTGEGMFLKQGERWKELTISQIMPESVVIKSSDGESLTLVLSSPVDEEVKPVSPLEGPIGSKAPPNFGNFATMPGMPAAPPSAPIRGMGIEASPADK